MARECSCAEWKRGIIELNNVLLLALIAKDYRYGEPPFSFCPWCGKALVEKSKGI